jgi:nucleoside 2-deoxyribosyltransferase
VFLPNAAEHAARKIAIAARYGIIGLAPLDDANTDNAGTAALSDDDAWRAIYHKDIAMMTASDIIVANLTPFRGASADAGTLVELGWFLGRGKKVFGYSNSALRFAERSRAQAARIADQLSGVIHESFDLPDNLMVVGAVMFGGPGPLVLPPDGNDLAFDSLAAFERCIALAARTMGLRSGA